MRKYLIFPVSLAVLLLFLAVGSAWHYWNTNCGIYAHYETVEGQQQLFKWFECNITPRG